MRYYKGRWNDDRGDEFASWGASDRYFEVEPDDTVVRQMEVYDGGTVLQYDRQHLYDRFGMLADKAFDPACDPVGFPCIEISCVEFETAWSSHTARNR